MIDIEIPLGKRTRQYRFLEMLPALISYGAVILIVVLSLIDPLWAAVYLLLVATTVLVKAGGIAFHTIKGRKKVVEAGKVAWSSMLAELENPEEVYTHYSKTRPRDAWYRRHGENLRLMTASVDPYPKPSEVFNAVIIATYNEAYEILHDTIETIKKTTYDNKHLIVVLAYEERGGPATAENAKKLKKEFGSTFFAFEIVQHPKNIPNEVVGKGGNITYAGKYLQGWLDKNKIQYKDVIVTTLDSDNRPHATYFDYVTYEYIVHDNRKHLSYQPVSLFLNNIWDVPAPMRVIATGNSFWNIISAMRPHTLRNFASHSQPMDALVEMNFWSTRTIVEDGHQYWRSWFYFGGNYEVMPIFVPIYQDAVLSDTYKKTLKAQFVQLRRWAYGASDVAYVGSHVFSRRRNIPFFAGFARFVRLLDGHVTLACIPILITFGGWIPQLINFEASRSVAASQLPEVMGVMQRFAMIGLVITVFLTFKMLPPRPARYKRRRTIGMLLQWVLMPVTALVYSSASAYTSQTRLLLGKYLNVFDVTDKATAVALKEKKKRRLALRKK